jgi:hypothetical protein
MNSKRLVCFAILFSGMALLNSCVNQTTIPMYGRSLDARKLNDMTLGRPVWLNNEAMTEPPVTVRWALDTFFISGPGGTQEGRSYSTINAISFRYPFGGAKIGAIGGGVVGTLAGIQYMLSNLPDAGASNEERAKFSLYSISPYVGGILGAGIGYLIGYMIGTEEHIFLVHSR